MKKGTWGKIADWFLVVGGLNWGLTLLGFNLVSAIGNITADFVAVLIYLVVVISAVYKGYRLLQ